MFGILAEIWSWHLPKLKPEAQSLSRSYSTYLVMYLESWLCILKFAYVSWKLVMYLDSWLCILTVGYVSWNLVMYFESWLCILKFGYVSWKLVMYLESWLCILKVSRKGHGLQTSVNLLKPKTYIMYQHLNIQKFCVLPTQHLCVLGGSQNKQRIFLYISLTYRFLKSKHRVFTARYEMGL